MIAAKGGDGAGRHAEHLFETLGAAEGEPVGADELGEPLQVDGRVLAADDEEVGAFAVLQEQVLAVGAGNVAAQRPRFLHRMKRRMLHGVGLDSEGLEEGDEIGARFRHGCSGER